MTSAGALWCWGDNASGDLGDGTSNSRLVPVRVAASGVAAVFASDETTCAQSTTGGVQCWGDDGYGELGDGLASGSSATPVDVFPGLSSGVRAVALNDARDACALSSAGGVLCWGYNDFGQIGNGTSGQTSGVNDAPVPTSVVGLSSGVAAIATGYPLSRAP